MKKQLQRGVMLLEAMIAVTLLAIGLLGAIGIQARSFGALSDATMRAEATMASENLVALMTNDQMNAANYSYTSGPPSTALAPWYTEVQRVIPGATVNVTVSPLAGTTNTRVDISISWARKAGDAVNTHRLSAYMGRHN
jgi:type IV pilus assembly protein PilV